MGFLAALRQVVSSHDQRIDALQAELRALKRAIEAPSPEDLYGEGILPLPGLASQVDITLVEITSGTSGSFSGKRKMLDGSGTWVDDDEDASGFTILPAPGAAPFQGCRGLAMFVGPGAADAAVWWMFAGECLGFDAKITSVHDASFTYQWEQVGLASGLTDLTYASSGLDRAFNIPSVAYDPDVALADRDLIPVNTRVKMHWNPDAERMEFSLGREPQSEEC